MDEFHSLTSQFITKLKELPDTQRKAFIKGIAHWFKKIEMVEAPSSQLVDMFIALQLALQSRDVSQQNRIINRIVNVMFPQTDVVQTTFQEELLNYFPRWFKPIDMCDREFYNQNLDDLLNLLVAMNETAVQINKMNGLHGGRSQCKKHSYKRRNKRSRNNRSNNKRCNKRIRTNRSNNKRN